MMHLCVAILLALTLTGECKRVVQQLVTVEASQIQPSGRHDTHDLAAATSGTHLRAIPLEDEEQPASRSATHSLQAQQGRSLKEDLSLLDTASSPPLDHGAQLPVELVGTSSCTSCSESPPKPPHRRRRRPPPRRWRLHRKPPPAASSQYTTSSPPPPPPTEASSPSPPPPSPVASPSPPPPTVVGGYPSSVAAPVISPSPPPPSPVTSPSPPPPSPVTSPFPPPPSPVTSPSPPPPSPVTSPSPPPPSPIASPSPPPPSPSPVSSPSPPPPSPITSPSPPPPSAYTMLSPSPPPPSPITSPSPPPPTPIRSPSPPPPSPVPVPSPSPPPPSPSPVTSPSPPPPFPVTSPSPPPPSPVMSPSPPPPPSPITRPPPSPPPPVVVAVDNPVTVMEANTGSYMSASDVAATLNRHNQLRANHNSAPLQWDSNLAAIAQSWASQCRYAHSGSGYGESIGRDGGSPAGYLNRWYSEICYYDWSNPTFNADTSHFSQMVWAGTRRVGCAMSSCPSMSLLVCEYDPPGNYVGSFAANVNRPNSNVARC